MADNSFPIRRPMSQYIRDHESSNHKHTINIQQLQLYLFIVLSVLEQFKF